VSRCPTFADLTGVLSHGCQKVFVFLGLDDAVLVFRLLGQKQFALHLSLEFSRHIGNEELHECGDDENEMLENHHEGESSGENMPVHRRQVVRLRSVVRLTIAAVLARLGIILALGAPLVLVVGRVELREAVLDVTRQVVPLRVHKLVDHSRDEVAGVSYHEGLWRMEKVALVDVA
jgi:hypothetical protein